MPHSIANGSAESDSAPVVDVLIVGGGYAGLSAALSLARTTHTVALFDGGSYRNSRADWMHTIPTWDSKDPKDYRKAAREEILAKYETVDFIDATIATLQQVKEGSNKDLFCATLADGKSWFGRKVILAAGLKDDVLDIPGYEHCYTQGIYHCMVHRGIEEKPSESAGVLSIAGDAFVFAATHIGAQVRNYANQVTIYTHGNDELAREAEDQLLASGFKVDNRKIVKFEKAPKRAQVTIHFEDGDSKTESFLVHRPTTRLSGDLAEQLGLEKAGPGLLKTTAPFYETTLPGVFAAGDVATPFKISTLCLATGAIAAAGIQAQVNAARHIVPATA